MSSDRIFSVLMAHQRDMGFMLLMLRDLATAVEQVRADLGRVIARQNALGDVQVELGKGIKQMQAEAYVNALSGDNVHVLPVAHRTGID